MPKTLAHHPFVVCDRAERLLSVILVRHCQLLATLGTARSEYATAVLRGHSLAETVLVHAATIVRLKCSFHFIALFNLLLYAYYDSNEPNGPVWAAKLLIIFEIAKN